MTNPTIPADLIAALPSGIALETCTTTTYGELCAAHDVESRQRYRLRYADIADDALVVVLPGWVAYDGHGDVVEYLDESREDAAREYVDRGEWNATETTWIEVRTSQRAYVLDADGDAVELVVDADWHSITLDPDEPECEADEHDWQSPHEIVGGLAENPGVYGHGGGVIITEVCAHCGRYRVRDTWAQNRTNGAQGLESVEYRDADDASRGWIEKRREAATLAAQFRSRYDDTADLMTALDADGIKSEQDWGAEATTWTFADGSQIRVSGPEVEVLAEGAR